MTDTVATTRPGSAAMQGDLWSARARDYAELQEIQFRPLYESVLQRPEVATAGASLDVGCGPGLAAQVFAQKITNVSGIDASAAFIAIASQRLPGRDFRVGEMETLPHADASFDVVTGFNAFQYAASPRNALAEARRVLRPGGTIVIATWGLLRIAKPPATSRRWALDAPAASRCARSVRSFGRIQLEGAGD